MTIDKPSVNNSTAITTKTTTGISTKSNRFFRRPKPPKLERVELIEPREPEIYNEPDSDDYDTDSDEEVLRTEIAPDGSIRTIAGQNELKLPPINQLFQQFTREQLISIVEETTITNDSTASYENLRIFRNNTNPTNSPVSPQIARAYNSPVLGPLRASIAKSYHSELPVPPAPATSVVAHRRSLMKAYKPLGPDPLPARAPKMSLDEIRARQAYYKNFPTNTDSTNQNDEDYFELNDFLLDSAYNQRLVASCVKSISKYNYRQVCCMLENQIKEERNRNCSQVC